MMSIARAPDGDRGFWPALTYGLRPLGALVLSLLAWLVILLVAQHLMADAGFLTQRLVGTVIIALGLLQGAVTFFLLGGRVAGERSQPSGLGRARRAGLLGGGRRAACPPGPPPAADARAVGGSLRRQAPPRVGEGAHCSR